MIPSAQMIESAIEYALAEAPKITADKKRELGEACGEQAKDPQFVSGYLIGLATGEVILAMRGQEL